MAEVPEPSGTAAAVADVVATKLKPELVQEPEPKPVEVSIPTPVKDTAPSDLYPEIPEPFKERFINVDAKIKQVKASIMRKGLRDEFKNCLVLAQELPSSRGKLSAALLTLEENVEQTLLFTTS